jgi:hypothetical protein
MSVSDVKKFAKACNGNRVTRQYSVLKWKQEKLYFSMTSFVK